MKIPAGSDSGELKINKENIGQLLDEAYTTGSRAINFKRNRSKFEIEEIDQVVFRLEEVVSGTLQIIGLFY